MECMGLIWTKTNKRNMKEFYRMKTWMDSSLPKVIYRLSFLLFEYQQKKINPNNTDIDKLIL